jgi:hypothetical protein
VLARNPAVDRHHHAIPVAQQKVGVPLRIIFEAKRVSDPDATPPLFSNDIPKVVINNWSDVNNIYLTEFTGGGNTACSGLTTDLHIKYTADHELMASWNVAFQRRSPSGVPPRRHSARRPVSRPSPPRGEQGRSRRISPLRRRVPTPHADYAPKAY